MTYLFVSFYTDDALYTRHARRLKHSLHALDLPHQVEVVPRTRQYKNWQGWTYVKPAFILWKLYSRYEEVIIWIDADAEVLAVPELLFDPPAPICHMARRTGIMTFRNTPAVRAVVADWAGRCADAGPTRRFGDQSVWYEMLDEPDAIPFEVGNYPPSYSRVVPADGAGETQYAIIKHHQASREVDVERDCR